MTAKQQPAAASAYGRGVSPDDDNHPSWLSTICRMFVACTAGLVIGMIAVSTVMVLADAPTSAPTFSEWVTNLGAGALSGLAVGLFVRPIAPRVRMILISSGLCVVVAAVVWLVTWLGAAWHNKPAPGQVALGIVLMIIGHAIAVSATWWARRK